MMEDVLPQRLTVTLTIMLASAPTRLVLTAMALLACPLAVRAQVSHPPAPPPAQKSTPAPIQKHQRPTPPRPTGQHLAEWMNEHRSLTPEQQQQALEHEPGFNSLPPATQQRLRDRLKQLDAMPPDKQKHIIDRNEAMEHMTPEQRGEVRSAMQQLAALPPDQRRYVARTFRGLRELSPEQRQNVLSSERFSTLTDAQRSTLNSLMKVEPLLPPPYDAAAGNTPPPSHP